MNFPKDLEGADRLGWIAGFYGPSLPPGVAQELINPASAWHSEAESILAMPDEEVIASIEAEGRDPEALAEAMRGQMNATFRLCEEIKRWREEARSWRAVAERLETEKQAASAPAAREQIARILDPEAFAYGDRDYYGPDLDKATYSARLRASLKRAAKIAALPTPPVAPNLAQGGETP